jgi:hypothetical protein
MKVKRGFGWPGLHCRTKAIEDATSNFCDAPNVDQQARLQTSLLKDCQAKKRPGEPWNQFATRAQHEFKFVRTTLAASRTVLRSGLLAQATRGSRRRPVIARWEAWRCTRAPREVEQIRRIPALLVVA